MLEETIIEIESLSPDERNSWLQLRSEPHCREILQMWSDTISLVDYSKLNMRFRTIVTDQLIGNSNKGVVPNGRIFYVAPAGEPVRIQVGWNGNKRAYKIIDNVVPMPADVALSAMSQHGCLAKVKTKRDGLIEVSMDEMIQIREAKAKPKRKRRAKKKKAVQDGSSEENRNTSGDSL